MRIFLLAAAMSAAFGLTYVKDVEAFGLGMASSFGVGKAEHTYETVGGDTDYKYKTKRSSAGIVLDTNLSNDSLFNYRLGVGYEEQTFSVTGSKYEAKGITIENDFGFKLVSNRVLRLWAGPEVKLSFLKKDWGDGTKTSLVEFGIGPVVGVNLNLGPLVTLSAKSGFIVSGTGGTRTNIGLGDTDIEGSGGYPFINFGLLFRIGEN